MKFIIVWLQPYRPGHVASVTRGCRKFDTQDEALAQIAKYKIHFPGNRYSVEPAAE